MTEVKSNLRLDQPLKVGTALETDLLDRSHVAARVVDVLGRVSSDAGLVVSIEGAWGSGKTSVLAMVEELLKAQPEEEAPVIVHFNPWLIGDRDALLRQFIATIAKAVKVTDQTKVGKRVVKELKTYSKAFDVLKLIPGAEPWASIVKSVVESVGDAGEAVFDYKTPDIEERKHALEKALRKFPQRIVVLLDDLDRLYPAEAYEMVRIVKAVGDLPNIGYVLAWDERYVSAALKKLSVPYASAYLDKVVQVRLPIPPLSFPQCLKLMNRGLNQLPEDALVEHFPRGDERLGMLFHHGLSGLIEHPRDVVRLYDVVSTIEPGLRGEIHLADIIGLASLITKAPAVYELLCRLPQAFVGRRPGASLKLQKTEEVMKEHAKERDAAIDSCRQASAVREVVQWLFPKVAQADGAFTYDRVVFTEGHLAHPDRLLVALQLSARPGDLSLVRVRMYMLKPEKRDEIAASLQEESCVDFIANLGKFVEASVNDVALDSVDLALAVARLVESAPFVKRANERMDVWRARAEREALETIAKIARRMQAGEAQSLAETVIVDEIALSVAAELAAMSYLESEADSDEKFKAGQERRADVLAQFAANVLKAASSGALFQKVDVGGVLLVVARLVPDQCKAIFTAIDAGAPNLDGFVEPMLRHSFDSNKGQSYCLPEDASVLEQFVSVDELKNRAVERLQDEALSYPVRAAWRAVAEGQSLYGKDGSPHRR